MELGTLAGAAKGAAELANKNSGFFGKLFPYFGLEKKAVDIYIEDIEKSDMPAGTKAYLIMNTKKHFKELKNQAAIAEKAVESAKEGTDFSDSSKVDEEWLDRFMDSAKFVSSEEMQLIWGKVLAGEFENPGSTPRNLIRILSEFTPKLARAFRIICSMQVDISTLDEEDNIKETDSYVFVPYISHEEFFSNLEISFEDINELEVLGVIIINYYVTDCTGITLLHIKNRLIAIIQDNEENPELDTGNIMLTSAGKFLTSITEQIEIEGYYDLIKDYLTEIVRVIDDYNYILEIEEGKLIVKRKSEQE